MRSLLAVCGLFALGIQSVPNNAAPNLPFSLNIEAATPSVAAGDRIVLEISLTNTSDANLIMRQTLRPDQAEWDYSIDVRDAKGNEADETKYGHNRRQIMKLYSAQMKTLEPGKSLKGEVVLSKVFDLTVPGRYTIQVSRHTGDDNSGQLVMSNTTTLTVNAF